MNGEQCEYWCLCRKVHDVTIYTWIVQGVMKPEYKIEHEVWSIEHSMVLDPFADNVGVDKN